MPLPQVETLALPADGLGQTLSWTAYRYGTPGQGPKAYLQAGLHADEIPGMLVLHHLMEMLETADVAGEIIIVPTTNPIGLGQWISGNLLGRYELGGQGNFNRNYPWLGDLVAERIGSRLGSDAGANIALIRREMLALVAGIVPHTALDHMRKAILERSIDADIALDLHCDSEALTHLYLGNPLWPEAADLAADLDIAAIMLAEDSGGGSLDEAWGGPWWALAARFPDAAIPPACLAATVELRGEQDVSDELARKDAEGLFRFLTRRGVIRPASAGEVPAAGAFTGKVGELTATDHARAPVAGVLAYHRKPGDLVQKGEIIADVVRPGEARVPVPAPTSGLIVTRLRHRFIRPGGRVALILGDEELAHRKGYLLSE